LGSLYISEVISLDRSTRLRPWENPWCFDHKKRNIRKPPENQLETMGKPWFLLIAMGKTRQKSLVRFGRLKLRRNINHK